MNFDQKIVIQHSKCAFFVITSMSLVYYVPLHYTVQQHPPFAAVATPELLKSIAFFGITQASNNHALLPWPPSCELLTTHC